MKAAALHRLGDVFHIHLVGKIAERRFVACHIAVLAHIHPITLGTEAARRVFRHLSVRSQDRVRRRGVCVAIVARSRQPTVRMAPQHQTVAIRRKLLLHDIEHGRQRFRIGRVEIFFPLLHQFGTGVAARHFIEAGCSFVVHEDEHALAFAEVGRPVHNFGTVLQAIAVVAERVLRSHIDQHRLFFLLDFRQRSVVVLIAGRECPTRAE